MRIIRSKVARDFTVMSNRWIRDTSLSAKAKGIFAYLLTLPDNWDLHITELLTHFTNGEKSIRNGIRELTKKGYIHCVVLRKDNKISGNEYFLIQDPQNQKQDVQNRHVENEVLLNTNIPNTDNNINTLVDLIAKYRSPIEVLNNLTGRNFKFDNRTVLSNIKARVKDGSPIEEICEVIKFICKKRMGTEFEMYLRPSTVFNKTKYGNYLEEYKYLTNRQKCGTVTSGVLKDLN